MIDIQLVHTKSKREHSVEAMLPWPHQRVPAERLPLGGADDWLGEEKVSIRLHIHLLVKFYLKRFFF
jgi:hypothetical protein